MPWMKLLKFILPALLVLGAVWYVKSWYNHQLEISYQNGVTHERNEWHKRIEIENKKNREFEQNMQNVVNNFGKKLDSNINNLNNSQNSKSERINTIINQSPTYNECKVDPEVITIRNELREMGPK